MNDVHNFEEAFDYFNKQLFENRLRPCIITLQKSKRSRGYFSEKNFESKLNEGDRRDEIALNPKHFGRNDREILSTLCHEMVHQWQHQFGNPSRNGYHNLEWGAKMEAVGLMPSSTGEPFGNRTGQRVTHYIIDGGQFDRVCKKLLDTGFKVNWAAAYNRKDNKPTKNKIKHTCSVCGLNGWTKPGGELFPHSCDIIDVNSMLGLEFSRVKTVYRKMSQKWHPDSGGTHEAMQAVNEFYEALKSMRKT